MLDYSKVSATQDHLFWTVNVFPSRGDLTSYRGSLVVRFPLVELAAGTSLTWRYLQVAKTVLISAAVPALLQTDANPEGLPMDVFDDILAGLMADRSEFYRVWRSSEVRRADPDHAWEDNQIIPVQISAMRSAQIIKDAKEIIYPGAPHGISAMHQDAINSELLRVLESGARELDGKAPR
jgi:pimeloyl-ACP methyl ester carboxylesterase